MYWGLRAQNHRGHQSHGFLTFDNGNFFDYKNLDLVPKLKSSAIKDWFTKLPGMVGIGNVRYNTSGKSDNQSIINGTQPILSEIDGLKLAVSFNGNIVNAKNINEEITNSSSNNTYCDSDIVGNKLVHELKNSSNLNDAVKKTILSLDGAFSVIGITRNGTLFAFKDSRGIKPLCAGHSSDGNMYAFSSETVSFDINGFIRDFELKPGELVIVTENGFSRSNLIENPRKAFCAFEFAYFARPDSNFDGKFVYEIREEFGKNIVNEHPDVVRNADIILSVPETGDDPAMGVHEASGLRWERASRRHRYVTERAFILLDNERYSTIDRKVNILDSKVNGKSVIVVEDSIVRGDTTKIIIEKLRRAGAKKVYLFVTFPRIIGPCFYGIDMSTYGQLIGSNNDEKKIAKIIGADAVCYQSIEKLVSATGCSKDELCLGCITGNYPTPLAQKIADKIKKKFFEGYKEKGRIYEEYSPLNDFSGKTI